MIERVRRRQTTAGGDDVPAPLAEAPTWTPEKVEAVLAALRFVSNQAHKHGVSAEEVWARARDEVLDPGGGVSLWTASRAPAAASRTGDREGVAPPDQLPLMGASSAK